MQETQITPSQFVEARKDTPKMLDFADKTLNQRPLSIAPDIVCVRLPGIFLGWNDSLSATGRDFVQKIFRAIASIGNHILKRQINDQLMRLEQVVALSGGQEH